MVAFKKDNAFFEKYRQQMIQRRVCMWLFAWLFRCRTCHVDSHCPDFVGGSLVRVASASHNTQNNHSLPMSVHSFLPKMGTTCYFCVTHHRTSTDSLGMVHTKKNPNPIYIFTPTQHRGTAAAACTPTARARRGARRGSKQARPQADPGALPQLQLPPYRPARRRRGSVA